jgi:hypothetical protein
MSGGRRLRVVPRVPQRLQELMRDILERNEPELLFQLSNEGVLSLSPMQKSRVQKYLVAELCESGLLESDEPNDRGHCLEELIDLVRKRY